MNENGEMTFIDHLEALRFVILKVLAVFTLFFIPAWFLSQPLIDALIGFSAPEGFKLHYFSLMEPFFVRMKMSVVLDLFITLPCALILIWKFVAPGMFEYERKMLRVPFLAAFFLALFGIAFALFFLLPAVVQFSLSFSGKQMTPVIGIDSFVSMALMLILACGLMFQFPLVLYGLLASGVVRAETLSKQRPVVIVVILVVAALVTPPDVFSQVTLAIPTWLLFELSLLFFRFQEKRKKEQIEKNIVDDTVYRDAEKTGDKEDEQT